MLEKVVTEGCYSCFSLIDVIVVMGRPWMSQTDYRFLSLQLCQFAVFFCCCLFFFFNFHHIKHTSNNGKINIYRYTYMYMPYSGYYVYK